MNRWLVVVPPEGAAREMALDAYRILRQLFSEAVDVFDTGKWMDGYRALLRSPDEDIATDLCNQSLLAKAIAHKTTHLLVGALSPVTMHFLLLLRQVGVTTIHWFYEDYRIAQYWRQVVPGYQHWFAVQQGPMPEACRQAQCQFHFLPNGTSMGLDVSKIPWSMRPYDVVFLGVPTRYRQEFLQALLMQGIAVKVAGKGWEAVAGPLAQQVLAGQWVDRKGAAELYGRAKIVLNLLSQPTQGEDHQVSPRAFDALACGAKLLTERSSLNAVSLAGLAYEEFASVGEAVVAVQTMLRLPLDESAMQKQIGFAHENHSLAKRIGSMVELTRS